MHYDYIIIGAGSAGCILANRLSADKHSQVLLIEAGGKDNHPWFRIPMGYGKLYKHPRHNWRYQTIPQTHLNQRTIYAPRGKVQGGSGAINAMIYVRGAQQDFDDWATACDDQRWSYPQVLPYFKKLEQHWAGDTAHHSSQGNINIHSLRDGMHPVCEHYLQACHERGYTHNPDFNGAALTGYGVYDANIRAGKRDSSSAAYLQPITARDNLTILHHAQVAHLLFSNADGSQQRSQTASGVTFIQQGQPHSAYARREIILCAGAIDTPKLLELSGIGQAERLQQLGITRVKHLPAVGENMQDHICASYTYQTCTPTLNKSFSSPLGLLRMGLQYLLKKRGPLAMSVNQCGGFFSGHSTHNQPNLQLYFNPLSYSIPDGGNGAIKPDPYPAVLLAFNACRPDSRGSTHIINKALQQAPAINPNYLATEKDRREVIQGSHLIRQLVSAPALRSLITEEKQPGTAVQTDDEMLAYYRAQAGSIYHLCGSCTMGRDEQNSVVNSRLQVHGIAKLSIADASVFPNITSGNTNAPVMMLAEKAADLIIAR